MNNKPIDNNDRHPRTPIPSGNYINAQMWFSKEANTGGIEHTRITQHKRTAESIFLSCGNSFTIRNVWGFRDSTKDSYGSSETRLIAEDIDVDHIPENGNALKVYYSYKGYFPEMNVLVCFAEGNFSRKVVILLLSLLVQNRLVMTITLF